MFYGYRKWFLIAIFLSMISSFFSLIIPALSANLIDKGIVLGDLEHIEAVGFDMLIVVIIAGVAMICNVIIAVYAGESAAHILRVQEFKKIQTLSHGNIDRFQPSDLMIRLTTDTISVKNAVMQIIINLISVPFLLIGTFIMVSVFLPYLLNLMTVFLIIFVIILAVYVSVVEPKYTIKLKRVDMVNRALRESLTGIRVVKAFVNQKYEIEKYAKVTEDLKKSALVPQYYLALLVPGLTMIILLGMAGVYLLGGTEVIKGTGLLIGDVTSAGQYLIFLLLPIVIIAIVMPVATSANSSLTRIFQVLDAVPDILSPEHPSSLKAEDAVGRVTFENVSFCYQGEKGNFGEPVISDISFTIESGEIIGILGSTGSGKSTLISLIPRFYDVTKGRVTIDGVDVKDIDLHQLRRMVGICQQEVVLFSGKIWDTITFGSPDMTFDKMAEAAKAADTDGFVENIPEQYDSLVARRGSNFSGGQRQRLSIARTLALRPKILILDDSTSACDVVTEANIQDAINQMMTDSTVIIVAQRISSVITADRIFIMDNGKIIASGTHSELLSSCIEYQEIYESQLGQRPIEAGGV